MGRVGEEGGGRRREGGIEDAPELEPKRIADLSPPLLVPLRSDSSSLPSRRPSCRTLCVIRTFSHLPSFLAAHSNRKLELTSPSLCASSFLPAVSSKPPPTTHRSPSQQPTHPTQVAVSAHGVLPCYGPSHLCSFPFILSPSLAPLLPFLLLNLYHTRTTHRLLPTYATNI